MNDIIKASEEIKKVIQGKDEIIKNVHEKMQEIIDKDIEIKKIEMTKQEAEKFYDGNFKRRPHFARGCARCWQNNTCACIFKGIGT